MMQRVRMGMVGGGQGAFIGNAHRMAAALDGQTSLICGAFSRDHGNCKVTGAQLGLEAERCYSDYETMFAQEASRRASEGDAMQCVSIVTPNHLHVPIAKAAARNGFHIICDKPAAISLSEARELSAILRENNVYYALTHTYLGYPMVWQARHLADSGQLGAIKKVLVEYPQGWLAGALEDSGNKQAAWRTDPKLSGPAGAMADIGTHAQNLVEFITGSPMTEVSARLRAHRENRVLDDDGDVAFTLANGATGMLVASQVCTGEENSLSIRVYGEKASLEWRQMEPNTLFERSNDDVSKIHRAGIDRPLCDAALAHCRLPSGHPEGYLEAFANIYRHFALAIREPEQNTAQYVPGIGAGLRGMAFIEAVIASNAHGGVWQTIEEQNANLMMEQQV